MNETGLKPAADRPPESARSHFANNLITELANDQFRYHAWQRFMARSWQRSLVDIKESTSRTRSFWLWTIIIAAAGFGFVIVVGKYHSVDLARTALVLWLPWYAGSVIFVLTHLGMADDERGLAYSSLLVPNGLSYIRLALAPLILVPFLGLPLHPVAGLVFALFIAAILLTDILDGWIARRQKKCTRLGSMLDILADIASVTFLAAGLYLIGAIPVVLFWLLLARYPFILIGAVILYFLRGPAQFGATVIGKATTFASSILLLLIAFAFLVNTGWQSSQWIEWSVWCLEVLLATNILYLFYRAVTWKRTLISDGERIEIMENK